MLVPQQSTASWLRRYKVTSWQRLRLLPLLLWQQCPVRRLAGLDPTKVLHRLPHATTLGQLSINKHPSQLLLHIVTVLLLLLWQAVALLLGIAAAACKRFLSLLLLRLLAAAGLLRLRSQLLHGEWCKAQAAAVLYDGVAARAQVQVAAARIVYAHLCSSSTSRRRSR
jgi:hypothetical protein